MKVNFNIFDMIESPNLVLKAPNLKTICNIGEYKDLSVVMRYNAMSELSFSVIKNEYSESYHLLKPKKIVEVENIGRFMITSTSEDVDGIISQKNIVANSLEVELNFKTVTLLEGTYKFYDVMNFEKSLMGKLMEYLPNWKIGHIDSDLWDVYRTFDLASQSLYGFLMGDVENAYECVFEFDTFGRTISAKTSKNAVSKNDIFLTYDNLIKTTTIEEDSSELVTCLEVFGGSDLTINSVNPLGTSKIYNYKYYKTTEWISQELINAITTWEDKIKRYQPDYASLNSRMKALNIQLTSLKSELAKLEAQRTSLEGVMKAQMEQGIDHSKTWEDLKEVERKIKLKQADIDSKQGQIDGVSEERKVIHNNLSFSSNFTQEQLKELDTITIGQTYQNDCFKTTDIMEADEIQDITQQLYDQGVNVLDKVSEATYTFNMDVVNFVALKEYEHFTKQLKLGSQITLELEEDRYAYPVLLEFNMSFNEDSVSDIGMAFGNRLRLNSDDFRYSELFGETVKSSIVTSFDSDKWKEYSKDKPSIGAFINSSLDASKNNVINADNQEITIGENGLIGKRLNPDTGDYDPHQLWLMNKNLVFTKDAFQHVEVGIGEVLLPNGMTDYGVNANVILGKLIAGGQFEFSNDGGTFKFDSSGATLINANLLLTDGDGGLVSLEDKTASNLNSAITNVYTDMREMEQAIKDGEIVIFYEARKPRNSDGKDGDMWYDTTVTNGVKKNEAYLKRNGIWELIKDQEIIQALSDANQAQITADGKIKSYWQNEPPTGLQAKDLGDLWFDTNDGNKQYRWNGSAWVDVQDGAIVDANNKIDNVINPNTGEIRTDKLIGSIEAGKNNIDIINNASVKAMKMNEVGILIANSKTGSSWDWKTAISADGIVADHIKANGTITGVNIKGGTLGIGGNAYDNFKVTSGGAVTARDLTITGGSITLGNNFSVDRSGNVTANNLTLKGGNLNLNNLTMTGTIKWGALPNDAMSDEDVVSKISTNNDNLGITQTTIGRCSISSPSISAGTITGAEIKGGRIWGDVRIETGNSATSGIVLDRTAMSIYDNSTYRCGKIGFSNLISGAGNNPNGLLIESHMDYSMKLKSSGNMSLEAGSNRKVYIGNCQFMGTVVDKDGNPLGGEAVFG